MPGSSDLCSWSDNEDSRGLDARNIPRILTSPSQPRSHHLTHPLIPCSRSLVLPATFCTLNATLILDLTPPFARPLTSLHPKIRSLPNTHATPIHFALVTRMAHLFLQPPSPYPSIQLQYQISRHNQTQPHCSNTTCYSRTRPPAAVW